MWTSNTMLSYTKQTTDSVRDAITIPLDNCNAKPGNEIVVFENGEKIISFQKTAGTCRPGLTMVGEQPLVRARVIIFTLYHAKLPNQYLLCLWTYLISLVHQKTTSDINISFFFPEEEFSGIAPCKFRKRKSNPTSFPGFSLLLRERTVGLAT